MCRVLLTLAVHIGRDVELRDAVCGRSLQPDCLPDAGAGPVEDVAWVSGLFPNGNDIRVCWVVDKNEPCIGGQQMFSL